MESKNIMKTDLKSNVGIAEIRLDQVVTVLGKQLANNYYFLFTKAPTLDSIAVVLLLGTVHYD
jgi:hypothetical protein